MRYSPTSLRTRPTVRLGCWFAHSTWRPVSRRCRTGDAARQEGGDITLRELFVYRYRLMYRVREDRVVVVAFLHGARDFAKWQRELGTEL